MEEIAKCFKDQLLLKASSPAYAAIRTLTETIRKSNESTNQGLMKELEAAVDNLVKISETLKFDKGRTPLSVISSCDMFLHHIQKTLSEGDRAEFENLKQKLVALGVKLSEMRPSCLLKITQMALRSFRDNQTILVHGYSEVVCNVLLKASEKFNFTVLVTECRPYCEGYLTCEKLAEAKISYRLIVDNAVACVMDSVDMVMVGAEAVVENGGVINRVGTYGIGLIAKAFLKPLYVCTDSLKFIRMFPLTQRDLPAFTFGTVDTWKVSAGPEEIITPLCDLTPPDFITLLFTDLGILTPSGIYDQLIQLFR
jgi:translation initiation factor eIF-2B subunit alpha